MHQWGCPEGHFRCSGRCDLRIPAGVSGASAISAILSLLAELGSVCSQDERPTDSADWPMAAVAAPEVYLRCSSHFVSMFPSPVFKEICEEIVWNGMKDDDKCMYNDQRVERLANREANRAKRMKNIGIQSSMLHEELSMLFEWLSYHWLATVTYSRNLIDYNPFWLKSFY